MAKWVYGFGEGTAEGRADMKNLLGGKGANLAEMSNLGLPVPPGFTVTTEVCTYFYEKNKTYPNDLKDQFDEAEKLERTALRLSEEKFGPESAELAMTCTNLADVLWNKKELPAAGQLYRRAAAIDASLYGPDRPETAADIANLGMLMKDAGQPAAADALLRQALVIYEKTLGVDSAQAKFVRDSLQTRAH